MARRRSARDDGDAELLEVRRDEARRLESARDGAAMAAEIAGTLETKVAWLAAEQQVAAAWAAFLRAAGDLGDALKYSEQTVRWAAAHAKAVEQLVADRVLKLHAVHVRRSAAVEQLERELTR